MRARLLDASLVKSLFGVTISALHHGIMVDGQFYEIGIWQAMVRADKIFVYNFYWKVRL
ncbi:hypothetical protein ACFQ4F_01005 [Loigolactobacillus zhaoyuanensis]